MIFTCGYCPDHHIHVVYAGTVCAHCGASYRWDRFIAEPHPQYLIAPPPIE